MLVDAGRTEIRWCLAQRLPWRGPQPRCACLHGQPQVRYQAGEAVMTAVSKLTWACEALTLEVLVWEGTSINALAPCAIACSEVATLQTEPRCLRYDRLIVELCTFVCTGWPQPQTSV